MPYWGLSTAHYNSVLKQYKVDSFVSVILHSKCQKTPYLMVKFSKNETVNESNIDQDKTAGIPYAPAAMRKIIALATLWDGWLLEIIGVWLYALTATRFSFYIN